MPVCRFLAFLVGVSLAAYLAAPISASASSITYSFSGVSLTVGGIGTDTLSGYFTYDTSTFIETAADLTLAGLWDAGNYTESGSAPPPFNPPVGAWGSASCSSVSSRTTTCLTDPGTDAPYIWYINILFEPGGSTGLPPVPGTPDAISVLLYYEPPEATFGCTTCRPSEADPVTATPLPAALPLFATGLSAMGLFGWRRRRKASAAIAA